jgi:hypothetical protein
MLEKLKSLLKPSVSIEVKLTGIGLFIGKILDDYSNRIVGLESRQLQKGDKGDKGDSVDIDYVNKYLDLSIKDSKSKELEEIKVMMEKTWDKW